MRHKLTILFLAVILFFASGQAFSEPHGNGEPCATCHDLHHNDEYKQLKMEAILSGKVSCFACHSVKSDAGAPDTEQEFMMSQSHLPLADSKECLVCHDLGEKHMDGRLDSWPSLELKDPDPKDSHIYSGAKINNFCLSCHDNSPVTLGDPPQTPIDLSSAYEFTGHGKIDIDQPCTACHEHHASMTKPHMIRDIINNSTVIGNDNSVCFACHSYSSESYPGKIMYQSSEHGMREKLCIDCHNPHGDNKDLCYLCHNAKYSAHYSSKRDKLCVDCHNPHKKDDLKMTIEDEEKLCFLCHVELEKEFGNVRDGVSGVYTHHKVDDEEYGGGKVECFDCHNPHSVTNMNIVSEPGSSGWSMPPRAFPKDSYSFKTDMYDEFCLSCHDGSSFSAADIKTELSFNSTLESEFTEDGATNLHKAHKDKGYGCQNCHDAHSSRGTSGIKRGALLHEKIRINSWSESGKYNEGKNSCSSSSLGAGCH